MLHGWSVGWSAQNRVSKQRQLAKRCQQYEAVYMLESTPGPGCTSSAREHGHRGRGQPAGSHGYAGQLCMEPHRSAMTVRARNQRFWCSSPCAPIQKPHTEPIHIGKREGHLTAPGRPGPSSESNQEPAKHCKTDCNHRRQNAADSMACLMCRGFCSLLSVPSTCRSETGRDNSDS